MFLAGELLGGGSEVESPVKGSISWRSPSGWPPPTSLSASTMRVSVAALASGNWMLASGWGLEPVAAGGTVLCSVLVAVSLSLQWS